MAKKLKYVAKKLKCFQTWSHWCAPVNTFRLAKPIACSSVARLRRLKISYASKCVNYGTAWCGKKVYSIYP